MVSTNKNFDANILIIDDTHENLHLLSSILTKQGYNVRPVTNGQTAISAIKAKVPDLILLDIMMPDISGYEVCELLKSDKNTKDIPIIFISALDKTDDKVKAFSKGGVDFITKPFHVDEVLARINNQLIIQHQKQLLQEEILRRKYTEKKLKESKDFLESILNSSLDGIIAFNSIRDNKNKITDFICTVANPVVSKNIIKNNEVIIGKRLIKNMPWIKEEGRLGEYVNVVEKGKILNKELKLDNKYISGWFHIVAVKLNDGFAITIHDITKRKEMELILEEQAKHDGLTNISNRRYFDEKLNEVWRLCLREKQPLSLIICDVDFFKLYNDTYGHQFGDECLIKVAGVLKETINRPVDHVARYGGEEFALILPNTDIAGAVQVANTALKNIKHLKIPHKTSDINEFVTLSFGLTCIVPSKKSSQKDLIALADKALYQAKTEGRNRIAIGNIE